MFWETAISAGLKRLFFLLRKIKIMGVVTAAIIIIAPAMYSQLVEVLLEPTFTNHISVLVELASEVAPVNA